MSDIECPYCGAEQEINHDDGYGYDERKTYQQECFNCEKTFVFTTFISFDYEVGKADCLNGSDHKYRPSHTYPREFSNMVCEDCGDKRQPTVDEWKENWPDQMEDESLSKKKRNNAEHIASSFDNQFHCKYSDYLQKALESGKEISDIAEETLKEVE